MSNLHLGKNPTLSNIQSYIQQMVEERGFADQTVMQQSLLLNEEIGELMKCIRKSHANMQIDSQKTYQLDAGAEIADILIVLMSIANTLGVDVEQAFRDKEEQNKQRIWR